MKSKILGVFKRIEVDLSRSEPILEDNSYVTVNLPKCIYKMMGSCATSAKIDSVKKKRSFK